MTGYNLQGMFGDINGDGYVDLFVCTKREEEEGRGSLYLGAANGDFTKAISVDSGDIAASRCTEAKIADYDGDGRLDVKMLELDYEDDSITVTIYHEQLPFDRVRNSDDLAADRSISHAAAFADYDGDGVRPRDCPPAPAPFRLGLQSREGAFESRLGSCST